MGLTWEVFDAHGGRLVARLDGTEEELLTVYDRFTENNLMVVMAIGWTEGKLLKDGSVLLAYDASNRNKPVFRVVPVESDKPLTRRKQMMFPCEIVRWCRDRNEWINHEYHPGYLEASKRLVVVAASNPDEDFQLLY